TRRSSDLAGGRPVGLAQSGPRDPIDASPALGHVVSWHPFPEPLRELVGCGVTGVKAHGDGAPLLVGDADHDDVSGPRMTLEGALDDLWVHVLTAGDDDGIGPAEHPDRPLPVDLPPIVGHEPAVGAIGLPG